MLEKEKTLASYIDHTILSPSCSKEDIKRCCSEAKKQGFAAVCVPPYHVQFAYKILKDTSVKVATVIGFPMGYMTTPAKVEEIKRAIDDGVEELDVVVNINAIKSEDWTYVENDIHTLSHIVKMRNKKIKVIFEVELLTREEMERLCAICVKEDVHFVKTSTGINGKGNQVELIRFLREELPSSIKIKASGGIRTQEEALSLIEAGAERLGCSKSMELVQIL